MMAPFFFVLGLSNAVSLIAVFVMRRRRLDLVERYGWLYLLLAAPTVFGMVIASSEVSPVQHPVFPGFFLGFLALDGLYDSVLRLPFRERMDWRLLVPLVIAVAQFVLNAVTHGPRRRRSS